MASAIGIKAQCLRAQQFLGQGTPTQFKSGNHLVTDYLLPGNYLAYSDWASGRGAIATPNRPIIDLPGKAETVYGLPRYAGALELFFRRNGDDPTSKGTEWNKISKPTPLTASTDLPSNSHMTSASYSEWLAYNREHDHAEPEYRRGDDSDVMAQALRTYCLTGQRFNNSGRQRNF